MTRLIRSLVFLMIAIPIFAFANLCRDVLRTVRYRINAPITKQKTEYTCGPASMRSVFGAFGLPDATEVQLAKELKTNPEHGSSPENMVQVAKSHGLVARARSRRTYEELIEALKNGNTVVPLVQLEGDSHWLIIDTIDKKTIRLMDPYVGDYVVQSREQFMKRWFGFYDGRSYVRYGIEIGPGSDVSTNR